MTDTTTDNIVGKETWLKVMEESLNEFSTGMLGLEEGKILSIDDQLPESMTGAHVAMVSLQDSINIGLISSEEGCAELSRTFMAMEPDEELEEADVQDALGEIVNIVAGGVKTRLVEKDPSIKIGLPVFFKGTLAAKSQVSSYVLEIMIGHIHAKLFIIIDSN